MNYLPQLLLFLTLSSLNFSSPGNTVNETNGDLTKRLDTYFQAHTDLKKFNGAVLVQKNGKPIFYKAFNMSTDKSSSLWVERNAQFDIHSISKLLAKACIVQLEEQGKVRRSDPVSKYLPDFPNGNKITIQHLLDNQSGLPRELSGKPANTIDKSPEEIVELIKKETLLFEPGTEAAYSNLGYELIYFIIAQIHQKPFAEVLDQAIFMPFGMKDSGAHFHWKKEGPSRLAKNHVKDDDDRIVLVPNIEPEGFNQARIYSTLSDLMKFIHHVKDEPYRSALKNKEEQIGWSGGGDGILTHAKASLKSGYEIAFFSNFDDIAFGDILKDVERIMTGQKYELPKVINRKAIELDQSTMEQYTGKYRVREFNNQLFEFRIEEGNFVFYQNGERNAVLQPESDSTFFYEPTDEDYFEFRESEEGGYRLIFYYKSVEIEGEKQRHE